MRRLAVALLVAGLATVLAPVLPSASADPAPASPSGGSLSGTPPWLSMSVQSLSPRVVVATDTSVTVTGTLRNVSDRTITDLVARLQLGLAVTDPATLAPALQQDATTYDNVSTYETIPGVLAPGQFKSFTVTAPLSGPHSLNVNAPGVYPVLVNVQGVPNDSTHTQYRLAVATTLLPVLAPPGGAPATPTGAPAKLTVLWPLVDTQPRIVGKAANGQVVLSSDQLATSLSPGGRLFGLVDAVRQVAAAQPTVLDSLCFAVDPDLLDTVQDMTAGYQVRSGSGTVAGTGVANAAAWLSTLRTLTSGRCVLALPYADADLAAMAHAGGAALVKLAESQTAAVGKALGTTPLSDVAWPADGAADPATLAALTSSGIHTVLLDPASVSPTAGDGPVSVGGGGKVVPIDPLASGMLSPRAVAGNVDEQGIAVQDGIGAAVFRTVFDGHAGGSVLVAPPRRWNPSPGESLLYLRTIGDLVGGHFATPTKLTDLVGAPAAGSASLNYPPQAAAAEVNRQIALSTVADVAHEQDFMDSIRRDPTRVGSVLPTGLVGPLQLALLRSVSCAWRGGQDAGAQAALADSEAPFTALTRQVSVVQPNITIALGSSSSRLPVQVVNQLPVDVIVKIGVTGEAGIAPGQANETQIPAGGSDTVMVAATVTRSGRFSVYANLTTPGGTPLGNRARFELESSAYGTIILIVTGTAFGLLVLLSGRRIIRRVRTTRAAAAGEAPRDPAEPAEAGQPLEYAEHGEPSTR